MKKVSVVLTTKDRPEGLNRAIKSILCQTRLPEEIIIVDDFSKIPVSRNLEYPNAWGCQIKILRSDTNVGGAAARNIGVKSCTGDVIMFLDDDDAWEPNKVELQIGYFERDPEVGLVYSARRVITENMRTMHVVPAKVSGYLYPRILWNNDIGVTSAVAVRRDIFDQAGGFDEKQLARQDYDLWIRCAKLTMVAADPTPTVLYTIASTPSTQISGQYERHAAAVHRLMKKYQEDIAGLTWIRQRQVKWSHFFYVVKAARRHGLLVSLPWVWKCLREFPNPKVLLLLLPLGVSSKIRRIIGRGNE